MKKLLFLLLLPTVAYAEGPLYRHPDATAQLEFENVYQDLRQVVDITSTTLPTGSTNYIQNRSTLQPGAVFNVSGGTITGNVGLDIAETGATGRNLVLNPPLIGDAAKIRSNSENGMEVRVDAAGHMDFYTNSSLAKRILSSGEITQPRQPSFLVLTAGADQADLTGDGTEATVTFQTEIFDQNSDMAASTFTAPVTGQYQFTASVSLGQVGAAHTNRRLRLVTSNRTHQSVQNSALAYTRMNMTFSVITDMDEGDTARVTVLVEDSTKSVDVIQIPCTFSGTLLN